jgi:anaerobic magnesium-protoporphyrin IX monomethyl ester cyclase
MCLLRMRQAALSMIAEARRRSIPVIVAGSDASDRPDIYLEAGAATVITGEGEETLADIARAGAVTIDGVGGPIPGTCTRDADGIVRRHPPRPLIRDLDRLPRPAWDLVDVARYRDIWRRRHGYFSMNLATTRGCPYHCNWCAKPIYGQRYAARSPESVVDELAWLKAQYRPDHIWIADDIFGLKPGWIERFAELARASDACIPYKALLRADGVTEAVASALAASACRTVWIGAESGSQRVLDAMEKGIHLDQIVEATARLRARGITVGFFLQFGYPGETRDDIEQTLRMVERCQPDDIGVSVSYPLPGTPFYERVKAQLGAKQNWVDSNDLALMYRSTYPPEFYRTLHGLVHAGFRARRAVATIGRLAGERRLPTLGMARETAAGLLQGARLPWIRRRLDRMAAAGPCDGPAIVPVLSRRAAAVPSEQPH